MREGARKAGDVVPDKCWRAGIGVGVKKWNSYLRKAGDGEGRDVTEPALMDQSGSRHSCTVGTRTPA